MSNKTRTIGKSITVKPDASAIAGLLEARGIDIPAEVAASRYVRYIASEESPDTVGDVILAAGWDVSEWLQNPAMFADHKNSVASMVARGLNAQVIGKQLVIDAFFLPEDLDASGLASACWKMVKAGILSDCSVGFRAKQDGWRWATDGDRLTYGKACSGVYSSVLLKELSCVGMGAHPRAKVEAVAKSLQAGMLSDADVSAIQGAGSDELVELVERALFRLHPTTTVKCATKPVAPGVAEFVVDLSGIEAQIKAMGQHLANVERRALSQTQQKELGLGIFLPLEAAQKIAFLAESIEDEIEKYLPKTDDEEGNEPEPEPAPYTEDTSKAVTESSVAKELQDLSRTIQKKD